MRAADTLAATDATAAAAAAALAFYPFPHRSPQQHRQQVVLGEVGDRLWRQLLLPRGRLAWLFGVQGGLDWGGSGCTAWTVSAAAHRLDSRHIP